MDNLGNLFTYLSPQYQNSFFSELNFLFSVLGSMVSKIMCKLRHKLKNAQNLPELTSEFSGYSSLVCSVDIAHY